MDILEKSDKELLDIARPMWDDLVKFSNNANYGAFTRNFSEEMLRGANEIEMGKQFARSELTRNLHEDVEFMGTIRRGEHVTVLFKQKHKKKAIKNWILINFVNSIAEMLCIYSYKSKYHCNNEIR